MAEESAADSHENQVNNESAGERAEAPEPGHLSPEDVSYMESVQKKRLIVMIVAGIVILVLGFFAGKNLASHKSASEPATSYTIVAGAPAWPAPNTESARALLADSGVLANNSANNVEVAA